MLRCMPFHRYGGAGCWKLNRQEVSLKGAVSRITSRRAAMQVCKRHGARQQAVFSEPSMALEAV